MQYRQSLVSHPVSVDNGESHRTSSDGPLTDELPILPGMRDAENQFMKLDLPQDALHKLRHWK